MSTGEMRRGAGRRSTGRRLLLGGVAFAGVTAMAVPAFAHASFPGYSAFGFAPNTSGGTGAVGSTPPYAANTTVTAYIRAAGERSDPYNNDPDTNVDVTAIVPAGWTDPTCGAAKLQIKDASTNNTNQPGADVAGWTCEVYVSAGHSVIHWYGPQVQSPGTVADSAQFFSFAVKTPSPVAQTTYDGTNGTEGFIVNQTYASGFTSHWIPNAAFPGITPPGSETEVATGLVRTVAAFDPSTTSTTTSTTSTTSTSTSTTSTTAAVAANTAAAATPVAVSPTFTG